MENLYLQNMHLAKNQEIQNDKTCKICTSTAKTFGRL